MVENIPPSESASDQLIIVSGMSGSGKSVALRTLEDLGFYCVDNLPAALMPSFVQALSQNAVGLRHRLAVGVDVRNRAENLNRLPQILAELAQSDIGYRLVFLDTRD
uniref:RNase adapter RapZ n=1 Tax=Dokdonella sp. TaxID=2291710 RepID=UPI00261CACC4